MEGIGGLAFDGTNFVRKKRSSFSSRRPRTESQFIDCRELPSLSSAFASDGGEPFRDANKDNWEGDQSYKQRELKSRNGAEDEYRAWVSSSEDSKKSRQNGDAVEEFDDIHMAIPDKSYSSNGDAQIYSEFKRSSEGVLAPANWKSLNSHRQGHPDTRPKRLKVGSGDSSRTLSITRNASSRNNGRFVLTSNSTSDSPIADNGGNHSSQENKLTKVKLKVGGITHTIHTKPLSNSGGDQHGSPVDSSAKAPSSSDVSRDRHKLVLQDKSDGEDQSPPESGKGLQGIPWKDFHNGGFRLQLKLDSRIKGSKRSVFGKPTETTLSAVSEPIRKSKRVPKRRMLDGDFDGGDEDDNEVRYLERLKASKASGDHDADQNGKSHKQRTSRISRRFGACDFEEDGDYDIGASSRKENRKKPRSRDIDGLYFVDEEEKGLVDEDDETVGFSSGFRKKKKRGLIDTLIDDKKEVPLTTRQRALQSRKDPSSAAGLVEFPDGLPPAPSRKQADKTDMEQQLKKAEAAQRRRMQVEKAARESEAQAIRKILGQDANGKKRDEKVRKQKEEMALEKAERAKSLAANTVRWVMGPSGTVVSFPKDAGLPSIFSSQPCSYPPPRERCAGPSCTNAYKYRDSKSNLPLCSLQCYKAVNKMMEPVTSC
ncbi:uncharacterized protein LOC116263274 [Nymphaea colorata]|uniref:uncharacterized protein LOC116263274 n=1 Tax=Nymphaea colorata TaxID=210225 RepID=UPI00129E78DE|nr:uncharacterized protein LOC116263274 [Nymphaea colorata]